MRADILPLAAFSSSPFDTKQKKTVTDKRIIRMHPTSLALEEKERKRRRVMYGIKQGFPR